MARAGLDGEDEPGLDPADAVREAMARWSRQEESDRQADRFRELMERSRGQALETARQAQQEREADEWRAAAASAASADGDPGDGGDGGKFSSARGATQRRVLSCTPPTFFIVVGAGASAAAMKTELTANIDLRGCGLSYLRRRVTAFR